VIVERHSVKSSNIKSIGYDEKTKTLHVEFSSGGIYEYADVSPEKHTALMSADSIGGYLHKHIKGTHGHKKI
jgi:hypothetical protein